MRNFTKLMHILGMLCLFVGSAYSQASLVKDIQLGNSSSSPFQLINFNGILYFTVYSSNNVRELWKSDGTSEGTEFVKVFDEGKNTYPTSITVSNGAMFFTLIDDLHGRELWKSDGTAEGTVLVKDIWPGITSGSPFKLTDVNGTLFFRARDAIHGAELWKSDGTAEGTMLVKDVFPGVNSSYPYDFINLNGTLFFGANDGINNSEIWKSDGTREGTVRVTDMTPQGAYNPYYITNVNETLFFRGDDGIHGNELWKSDGTDEGTVLVKDIYPGSVGRGPEDLINVDGTLYFFTTQLNNKTLWKSDGTTEGTLPADEVMNKVIATTITNLYSVGNILFFVASSGNEGKELWRTDGTAEGTYLAADINSGSGSSNPSNFANIGSTLYFQANDGIHGAELWKYELANTYLVSNFTANHACINGKIDFTDNSSNVNEKATYYWDFGDGNISTIAGNVTHTYAKPGEYTVTLRIVQEENSVTFSKKITVAHMPKVMLSPFDDVSVTDAPFALTGGSPAGGEYSGPGVSNGQFDPAGVGPGKYEISYAYADPVTSCSDTARQEITVLPANQQQAVVSFTLVNAKTDTDIMTLTDGMQVYIHDLPRESLNIRANTQQATVGSVYFSMNGPLKKDRTDRNFPYAVYWDNDGNYGGKEFGVGTYTISATPYSKSGLKGEEGTSLALTFEIVDEVSDCAGFSASITQITDVSSCRAADGSATVAVSGHEGTVAYQWSNGATTATATGLAMGSYSVSISDARGCSETLNVYIGGPASPEVSLSSFALVNATDAPFVLSGGAPAGGIYSGEGVRNGMFDPSAVGSGSYEVSYAYTDPATQCMGTATQTITVAPANQGNAVVSYTLINARTEQDIMPLTEGMRIYIHDLPNGPLNIRANTQPATVGSVYLSLSGPLKKTRTDNKAPYAVYWDKDGKYGGNEFGVGAYTITATPYSEKRLNGDKGTSLALHFEIVDEVNNCAGFTASFSNIQDVSSCGAQDGAATVAVSGNTGNVTYSWSNGAVTATAGNLSAGDYTVTVTDGEGCEKTLSVSIKSPDAPIVTLAPFSSVVGNDPAFALGGGAPAGGIYSGEGVRNGMFDPSVVEAGNYEIQYTYVDAASGCSSTASQWIEVQPVVLGMTHHIERLVLVNANTDTDIVELTENMQLNWSNLPNAPLNIRAETYPSTVSNVVLSLSGPIQATRKEGVAPYALFGDNGGNYGGKNFEVGSYTVSAIPYIVDEVEIAVEGMELSINFTIADNQGFNARVASVENGKTAFEVEGEILSQSSQQLTVYPNPFTRSFKIEVTDTKAENIEVHLTDLAGKTLFTRKVKAMAGEMEIDLDENLSVGTYLLKVQWEGNVEMIKVIKVD